ncbi:hypothetical protein [Spirulina major]|uniref:hypothetical protein n=1 Tax=Spirulina major TaxID=270636 RepID=UPI00093378AA|nr:hypothetical protein [Spirulina major]
MDEETGAIAIASHRMTLMMLYCGQDLPSIETRVMQFESAKPTQALQPSSVMAGDRPRLPWLHQGRASPPDPRQPPQD